MQYEINVKTWLSISILFSYLNGRSTLDWLWAQVLGFPLESGELWETKEAAEVRIKT